ncbi:primosomal protein N' [Patescibacteria group bacterium]
MYRLGVIPETKTQLGNTQVFSYLSTKQIKPGTLVRIPFGKRNLRGLVWDEEEDTKTPKSKLKEIIEAVEAPTFEKPTRDLLKWIADYYQGSYGQVLAAMLPRELKRPRQDTSDIKLDPPEKPHLLTTDQKKAWDKIETNLKKNSGKFLLHGITGSGKTEIYFNAIENALNADKQVLFLLPEIALTAQEHDRISARFPEQVYFWHSGMSASERFNIWQKIGAGEPCVIVGPRSASLLPFHDLGLIVVDEEHDDSYKQYDLTPLYDARLVAEKLADFWPATLIMGSATPNITSYYRAKDTEDFELLTLSERIEQRPLPPVTVIDLRQVERTGTRGIFSEHLQSAIADTLDANKQILLFLNRRGAASSIICTKCGFVFSCDKCLLPLTYHQSYGGESLRCHHCGQNEHLPSRCPECQNTEIKKLGLGTQTVEKTLVNAFPGVHIARMDSDTMQNKDAHHKLFSALKKGEIDILIGTQMITKGWDIPQVDLVGVVLADTALTFPDYRSQERAFQLLTQVAGRAGRGDSPGQVIVQTYQPENFAIQAAAQHDFELFYDKEIKERREMKYPPFTKLALLTLMTKSDSDGEQKALELSQKLIEQLEKNNSKTTQILGPTSGFIPRLRGKYIWQILLNGTEKDLRALFHSVPNTWKIDVDPVSTL